METASTLMTKEVSVLPLTATVRQALAALQELEVRHLPVVNEAHEVVGMVSDRDLVPLADHPGQLTRPISRVMSADVVTAGPSSELDELVDLMIEQRIGAIPIVDADHHLAGIVSYVDVLRALPRALAEVEGEPR